MSATTTQPRIEFEQDELVARTVREFDAEANFNEDEEDDLELEFVVDPELDVAFDEEE
jgi:hypothetical protein